jgi:hypothetical protein
MPIIIKKGSEGKKKKKKNGEMDAKDMTDVLDFQVYRVSKPNFADGEVKVNLIGEIFYHVEEETTTPATVTPATVEGRPPTLMDKLEKTQVRLETTRRTKKDVFERVKQIQRHTRFIRLGQSLEKHFAMLA